MRIVDQTFVANDGYTFCYYFSDRGYRFIDVRDPGGILRMRGTCQGYAEARQELSIFFATHGGKAKARGEG